MTETFIYNERWIHETEERLHRQRRQLRELRERITAVRAASEPGWAAGLSYTGRQAESLEYSLKKTGDALKQFQERVEALNRETTSEYSDALVQSMRVFS